MSRPAAAALAALLLIAATARASETAPVLGTVLTAEPASDPFADGASGAGSLVVVDEAGRSASYSVIGTTRLTLDGKRIAFAPSLVGDAVARVELDPQTKTLTALDLKTPARAKAAGAKKGHDRGTKASAKAASATVSGEVAFTDAVQGFLSVRTVKGRTRKFLVGDATTVQRERADGPAQDVAFETVAVGDAVEVRSRDGKTADRIRVRAASR